jgi:hypothetical protein
MPRLFGEVRSCVSIVATRRSHVSNRFPCGQGQDALENRHLDVVKLGTGPGQVGLKEIARARLFEGGGMPALLRADPLAS